MTVLAYRTLRLAGGDRVARARWNGTHPGNPFASAESRQLGGIFLLFVGLSALLASVSIASYVGPHGGRGMPYSLILMILAVCVTLAVAIWRELWMRERRNGRD
ncbi:hypothetical protein [Roseomonas fluvialis]|uniref:Uncharacterized protein n=1 Tax=Roseomonas fluvialis TaxID=1750527 RepID=A0ABM7Y987_9PROT|nr:hypothetical protein [Roseomonas fluvialis]BDG74629.1 hypothetical protein Rmf_45580 [Roseomonas fluvialis]